MFISNFQKLGNFSESMWEIRSHQQSPQIANWTPHCQRKAALAGAQCELGNPQIKQKPLPPMPLEKPSFVL